VKLCEISNATGIHIHIVHHVKKGKESEPSGRYDAKGSGAISDNVHNSLVVWSNKEGIKDMPDVILKCDKQREGEWEGKIALNFERESLRFNEAFSTSHDE
jgi:twinkle protein